MAEANHTDTRVAVVTGGAGGLGQAYAERLARAGFDIAVADRVAADETAKRVEALGRRFLQGICDVTSEIDVSVFATKVQTQFGRADALVNNAGIFPAQPFLEMRFADFRTVVAVDLDGTFLFSRAFAPMMVARKWGRIVNIASAACWMSVPDNAHYMAAKMGVIGLSRGMASELGPMGISVNAIAPG